MKVLRDTWLIFKHNLLITLKNPIFVIVGLFHPLCFLIFFAPVLKALGSSPLFSLNNPLTVFLPGLLIMMAIYGTAYVGFSFIGEIRTGVVERLWVTPVSRLALVLGKSLRDIVILLVQSVILIGCSFIAGLEASLPGVFITLALVALVGISLSSCSYALALLLRDEKGLAATINLFVLPLQLLSGITLPLTLAPQWIKTTAYYNPLYHSVEGARALFLGNFSDHSIVISFIIMAVLAVVSIWGLIRTYRINAV